MPCDPSNNLFSPCPDPTPMIYPPFVSKKLTAPSDLL
jgi:hypothetical protein